MAAPGYLSSMIDEPGRAINPVDVSRVAQMLFATAAEGLVVVDGTGAILMHNPRLNEMFGYEDGELIGRRVEVLLPKSLHERHVQHRDRYQREPVQRSMGLGMDLSGERKDGSVFPVEVSLNHFVLDGRTYVMALVTDITLRQRAEAELQRTNQELEDRVEQRTSQLREAEHNLREALEKERELNSLKSRFVAMASHEFRTPLSTIMSSVDLIARYTTPLGDERIGKHVARIRGKVREMTAMLNDFLSLERIEQGDVVCQPVDLDVVHFSIELIEDLRSLTKVGQTITYDHAGSERNATLDRQMLSNIFTNLVTNAVKYSPEGKSIHVRTSIDGGRFGIEVADEGIGIPDEDQEHLFERFFRGSNATTVQGTGLGLNLVKRYLDLMHGTIAFTSRPGATTFTVQLPQHLPTP